MALKWCPGKIVEKHVWADGLFTLKVDVQGIQPFQPGQFLQLGYQNGDEHIHRPYSVASPWGPQIEFFVVKVDEGQLTPWLWEREAGDSVDVNDRAAGSFTLRKAPDAEILWLVATGTGLAPYIAMLRTSEPWQRYRKIVVVHGVRVAADLAYAAELGQTKSRYTDRFAYVPALTRDEQPGTLQGRIPALLKSGQLEEAVGWQMTAENSAVMLCGNPAMLDDMEEYLATREMKRHRSRVPGHIVLERYW
jgi:ferredoxin--NADP+ reductase